MLSLRPVRGSCFTEVSFSAYLTQPFSTVEAFMHLREGASPSAAAGDRCQSHGYTGSFLLNGLLFLFQRNSEVLA